MNRRHALSLLIVPMLAVAAALAGCDGSATNTLPPPPEQAEPRMISLAPALTQMIADLGQDKLLVGVAENDAAAPPDLPRVGNFLNVNTEAVLALKPTHVFMMTGRDGVPEQIRQLAQRAGFELLAYPTPTSVTEVGQILFDEREMFAMLADPAADAAANAGQPRTPSLGTALGVPVEAQRLKLRMLMRLANLSAATADAEKPRVLVVIGTNPIMASGPRTVLHELLTSFAGGTNAADEAAVGAPTFDREKLIALAPDVVLLIMPGGAPMQPIDEDSRLAPFRGLDIPAVQNNRFVLIDDPRAHLPSTTLVDIAALMAKAIHPDRAERIDAAMAAEVLPPAAAATDDSPTDAAPPTDDQPAAIQPAPEPAATEPEPAAAQP